MEDIKMTSNQSQQIEKLLEENRILKKENAGLKKDHEFFRYLSDQFPQLIAYTDKNLVYRYVNKVYEKAFKKKRETIIGQKLPDLIGQKAFTKALPHVRKVLSGQEVRYLECYEYPSGNKKYMDGHLIPDFSPEGEVKGYFAMLNDISQHLDNRENFHNSQLQLLTQNLLEELWIADLDLKLTYVSPFCENIFGFTQEERVTKKLEELYTPNSMEKIEQLFHDKYHEYKQGKISNTPVTVELEAYHKNGHTVWVESKAGFLLNTSGELIGIQGITRDITEKKRMRDSLQERDKQLEDYKNKSVQHEQTRRELATISLYVNEKNKLIEELTRICRQKSQEYKMHPKDKQEIDRRIKSLMDIQADWQQIKSPFESVHQDFFTKLLAINPRLTQNDLRHCAYIKMNFSTKEIARMMNVKNTTVQKNRARLKKKLNISREKDIFQIVHDI